MERNRQGPCQCLNLKEQKPKEEKHTADLLKMLKDKYPVLTGVSNDDILSRINIVYSRVILTDMYLHNIEKIHDKDEKNCEE